MDAVRSGARRDRAVDVGLDFLRHVGIDWAPHPTKDEVRREYEQIWSLAWIRSIEEVCRLAADGDPEAGDSRRSDQAVRCRNLYGSKLRCVDDMQGGQSQPRAGKHRRILPRLCLLGRIANLGLATTRPVFDFGQVGFDLVERRGLKQLPGWDSQYFVVPSSLG